MFDAVKQFCVVCLTVVVATSAGLAEAHQQQEAYTTLLFNPRSGNLEISHRFYSHDAEFVLSRHLQEPVNLTSSIEQRAEFLRYVAEAFEVRFGDQQPALLTNIGSELEGQYIWVYQEIPIPADICVLTVKMIAFHEIWPHHANHINVEVKSGVQSARLTGDDPSQSFKLKDCPGYIALTDGNKR